MSSVQYNIGNHEEDEVDFFHVNNVSNLSRPSDHFKYAPPPRHAQHLAARFLKDPVTTTLSSFSKVANYANYVLNSQEQYDSSGDNLVSHRKQSVDTKAKAEPPPPPMPEIHCSEPQMRLPPLTQAEFDEKYESATKEAIVERIFKGGIACPNLRRNLWCVILNLCDDFRDFDWKDLMEQFYMYERQWMSILPDQESRFTAYRERKSIAERDVIRSDRSHPFFAASHGNIDKLRALLMTYIMYDFDTGYVQGMSDLASPLLYMWDGDVVKAFWFFVQIMKLLKRNFEMSQNAISFQLKMLMKLIKITDPYFADYLKKKESDNCYFAFRWIICLFKREFMKSKTDDYDDCLNVWETIWCANILSLLRTSKKSAALPQDSTKRLRESSSVQEIPPTSFRERLSDVEVYLLSLCLAIIRRERNSILLGKYDACEILKHFNTLSLKDCVNEVLQDAAEIWHWLEFDDGLEQLYREEKTDQPDGKPEHNESFEEGFVVLQDDLFLSTLNV